MWSGKHRRSWSWLSRGCCGRSELSLPNGMTSVGFCCSSRSASALERDHLEQLAQISARLRKEREFSFYGDIDFIPTEQYSREDAEQAMVEAQMTVEAAAGIIPVLSAE